MSYQVLARKWRPRSFATLVGQEHVVKALSNALSQGRLHHAYLLTGTRGVGKTTIARIMAKALNCETGITAEPCGQCGACQQIDAGRFVDLLEIDAASNTGVDNIREVLDNAQYSPASGRFKVYIIDEVHMLSKGAFNAMLKTLEEPPGHVKFILATTDPQKVPVTVLSRCLQFALRQMLPAQITGHLRQVLETEALPFEADALPLLSQAAAGSMRDALSLLDQAIAYGAGRVEAAGVRAMLGAVDRGFLFELLDRVVQQDGAGLMQGAEQVLLRGIAPDAALQELASVLHQVALAQAVPESLTPDSPHAREVAALAAALSPEDVQLYYQIALHGRRDLPLAPDEFAGFSMALLRMLAFRPVDTPAQTTPSATVLPTSGAPSSGVRSASSLTSSAGGAVAALGAILPLEADPATAVPEPIILPSVPVAVSPAFDGNWAALVKRLPQGGQAYMLASHAELTAFANGQIALNVPLAHKALAGRDYQEKLRQVLRQHIGPDIQLKVALGGEGGDTPEAQRQRDRQVLLAAAQVAINEDPLVRQLVADFGANVLPGSIQPRTESS